MLFRPAHLLCLLVATPAGAGACGVLSGEATISSVARGGEILLGDGRRARFGGLQLSPEATAALGGHGGERLGLAILGAQADRWGRISIDLFGADQRSLTLDLLERGLARVRPDAEARGCEAERLEAETAAREAGEGLWTRPDSILKATDVDGLRGADGKFVVVAGVARRVGEGRSSVYIDFAGRGGFSVTVARKAEPQFRRAGVQLGALTGRKLRVRGVMDNRFGPRMEIADPSMMEVLERETGE